MCDGLKAWFAPGSCQTILKGVWDKSSNDLRKCDLENDVGHIFLLVL